MKKTISIFLAVLMFASSSGLAYAQHFCGDMEMMSQIILGDKSLSCGMEAETPNAHCSDEESTPKTGDCCKNHITKIQTDDNFTKASFDLKLNKTFVATFISVFILQEAEVASTQKTFFADYNPPPLEQDLIILYQTFLI